MAKIPKIKIKKTYKTIYQDEFIEIRKYPPCRRTIAVNRGYGGIDFYHLPLPYQIYIGVTSSRLLSAYGGKRVFSCAFAKKSDKLVYMMPFYGPTQPICVDGHWHYTIPLNADLGEAASRFWSTAFHKTTKIKDVFGVDTFEEWSKLSIDDVLERLHYAQHSLVDLIDKITKMYRLEY